MLSTNTSVTFLILLSQSNMFIPLWLAVVSVTKLVVHNTCLKVLLATICDDNGSLSLEQLFFVVQGFTSCLRSVARYVAPLWALPTAQTILRVGMDQ
jgi:hypothetical protein